MITATVDKNSIKIDHEELITSGSVKTNFIQFVFSEDWNGLTKTAIFQTKKVSIPVIVDGEDKVAIPWEAMAFPKEEIKFGVYGVRFDDESTESVDEEIVLPTIWGSLGKVVEGVLVESPPITDPTKDAYLQLLDYIKNLQPGGGEVTGGIPYVDQLVAPPDTYSVHDVESLIDKSLWYLTWSGDPLKVFGELEVGKEFSAYFLYDGEQLNPTLNYYGVFVFDEYDPDLTDRIKTTLKSATLIGNRTESLNSFLTFFKLDAVPELNVTTSIPFKSAVGLMPQWMNTAHRGLMTVGNELYLIDFRLEWLDHDNEAFQIKFTAIYPISNSGRDGIDGVTFIPFVSSEGVISFVNDGGLPNPDPVNIKGPVGAIGEDALVYSEILPFDNVTGDPAPVDAYSFQDSGTRFNRAPKLNETWTGVIVYYSGAVGENAKDVFVSTFKITGVSEEGYTSLLIDKKSVMPTITTDGSGSSEEPFITVKDQELKTPNDFITAIGLANYTGCIHAINSTIPGSAFMNDLVWISYQLVSGTYYLDFVTADGHCEAWTSTNVFTPFSRISSTNFLSEDELDLAEGTTFIGYFATPPEVDSTMSMQPDWFIGKKPTVGGRYNGKIHNNVNKWYDMVINVVGIADYEGTAMYAVEILNIAEVSSSGTDLTAGDGMTITDGVASVDTPVRNILTQSEFDALPEAEQNKGMYVISDGGSNGIKININGEVADVNGGSGGVVNWEDINGRPDLSSVSSIKVQPAILSAGLWIDGQQEIPIQGVSADETQQLILLKPKYLSQQLFDAAVIKIVGQSENVITVKTDSVPTEDVSVIFYILGATEVKEEYVGTFEWWSPKMTADNEPSPFVASASSTHPDGNRPYAAFDGLPATTINFDGGKWITNFDVGSAYIQIDLGKRVAIDGIRVNPAWSTSIIAPPWMYLKGSMDGKLWDTINEWRDINWAQMGQYTDFYLSNAVAYKFYRIGANDVTRNDSYLGAIGYGDIQFHALNMTEEAQ